MEPEIEKIKRRFQIANYISVSQMYLTDNMFLEEKLREEHLKPNATGHFGVSPAINFIYAHVNAYAKRKNKDIQYIIGEGHAGSALLTNLFLDGRISEYYKEYSYDIEGLKNLMKYFGTQQGFRTEINPCFPDTIYDGGELGYSLPTAIGASLEDKSKMFVCIIGDGEAETGTISASWYLNKIINMKNRGNVLPILNLNGLKMGSESIFSKFTDEELTMYFQALGYKVYIVKASHEEMYNTLESIDEANNNIIIFKSLKGWTAINTDKFVVEGKKIAHKNPMGKVEKIEDRLEYIEKWLKSYNISKEDIERELKEKTFIYEKNNLENTVNEKNIKNISNYDTSLKKYMVNEEKTSNVKAIGKMINDIIYDDNKFYVFSPDELESNCLNEIIEQNSKNVIEILNENICQALYFGHTNNGKAGIMISYEAFMPLITSMVSQYQKYIYQAKKINWRKPLNSMTYVLTSVCWENNYSHQNPEFLSSMLEKDYDFVNVYTPMDANSLIVTLDRCLKEKNTINVIAVSKRAKKQYKTLEEAKKSIDSGIEIFYETEKNKQDITLVAIGDYLIEEVEEAKNRLEEEKINIRIVYISKINILKQLGQNELKKYFGDKQPILVLTHTYANTIKGLLSNINNRSICVEGFKDKSAVAASYKVKLQKNGVSSEDIYLKSKEMLKENSNE